MPLLRGLRLLEAVETGNTSASCLESLLTSDTGRYSDFSGVMTLPGTTQVITASNTAMTCITGSNTATCILMSYPTSIAATLNSPVGSCVFFNGQNASNTANVVGNSNTALSYLATSAGFCCISNSTNFACTLGKNSNALGYIGSCGTYLCQIGATNFGSCFVPCWSWCLTSLSSSCPCIQCHIIGVVGVCVSANCNMILAVSCAANTFCCYGAGAFSLNGGQTWCQLSAYNSLCGCCCLCLMMQPPVTVNNNIYWAINNSTASCYQCVATCINVVTPSCLINNACVFIGWFGQCIPGGCICASFPYVQTLCSNQYGIASWSQSICCCCGTLVFGNFGSTSCIYQFLFCNCVNCALSIGACSYTPYCNGFIFFPSSISAPWFVACNVGGTQGTYTYCSCCTANGCFCVCGYPTVAGILANGNVFVASNYGDYVLTQTPANLNAGCSSWTASCSPGGAGGLCSYATSPTSGITVLMPQQGCIGLYTINCGTCWCQFTIPCVGGCFYGSVCVNGSVFAATVGCSSLGCLSCGVVYSSNGCCWNFVPHKNIATKCLYFRMGALPTGNFVLMDCCQASLVSSF